MWRLWDQSPYLGQILSSRTTPRILSKVKSLSFIRPMSKVFIRSRSGGADPSPSEETRAVPDGLALAVRDLNHVI